MMAWFVDLLRAFAQFGANTASTFGSYQPETPASLRDDI